MTKESDRELLEFAAKAAGYDYKNWSNKITDYDSHLLGCAALYGWNECDAWNPLEDDGDAFRLAIKLQIDICHEENDPHPTLARQIRHCNVWPLDGGMGISVDIDEPDANSKIRLAIVQQAAKIGRRMP